MSKQIRPTDFWNLRFSILFLAAVLIGNAAFLQYNAFRGFNMLDMGAFLDASWRIYKGQKPYIDFIYYSGPLHLYMNAFFFSLFGFGKFAIWAHLVLVHSIIISSVFLLARNYLSKGITALLTLLTTTSFYWSVSHPWHDVSAHFWGVLAVLIVAAQLLREQRKILFASWFLIGSLAVFSFLTKTNLGVAYISVLTVALVTGFWRQKEAFFGYAAGLFIGLGIGLLLIRSPVQYWEQSFLWNQGLIKARMASFFALDGWLGNYYWLAFVIVVAVILLSRSFQACKKMFILFSGITLIGIYAGNTGGMLKAANNFLWGIQAALAFLTVMQVKDIGRVGEFKTIRKFFYGALVVSTIFLTTVSIKYGLDLKVWTYFIKRAEGNYSLQSKPLKGWKFYVGQGMPLDEFVKYAKQNIPAHESILNLTDMYMINSLTGRPGYRGIPFMFLKDTIPLPGPEIELVRKNILTDPPDWIIMDVVSFGETLLYLNLYQEIAPNYLPVMRQRSYVLMKRKESERSRP